MSRVAAVLITLLLGACTSPAPQLPTQPAPPANVDAPVATTTETLADTPDLAVDRAATPAPVPLTESPPTIPSEPVPQRLRIAAVGDIMLGGSMREFVQRRGYDYPFDGVRALIDADLLIGNLEGPLTARGAPLVPKKYLFRTPEAVAPALARAGFHAVSLANNHSLDYGPEGLEDTRVALDAAGIAHFGAGPDLAAARRGVVLETGGYRVGLLGYSNTFPEEFWAGEATPGTAFGHAHQVREDVARLRAQSDLVVVSFHWGRERQTELRDYQPLLARTAIDAGAAVVLGHHPHILQAVERYADGVILYSLGNFTFGSYSPASRDSAVALLDIEDGRLRQLQMVPIDVYNQRVLFQPQLLSGDSGVAVVRDLSLLSAARGTLLKARNGRAVLEWP